MIKVTHSLIILIAAVLILSQGFSLALAQTPATVSGNLDEITESVKKRIQGVIKDQLYQNLESVIYGKLNSIASNTLSVNHNSGIKLASTSASTQYLRLPGNTKLNFEDLTIDEYIIVVGTKNESEVIDAAKVISQKTPPAKSDQKTFFGRLYTYDTKKFLMEIKSTPDDQIQSFQIGRKSNVYLGNSDGTKTKIDRKQDLPVESQVLVLFEGATDPDTDPLVQEMLVIPSSPIITPAELKP